MPVELEEQGLMAALEEFAADQERIYGVPRSFSCESPVLMRDDRTATNLYHIAWETTGNAIRHGKPEHVEIDLAEKGR